MARIRYVGAFPQQIPGVGVVSRGDEFEVDDQATAADLLRRAEYFEPADAPAAAED